MNKEEVVELLMHIKAEFPYSFTNEAKELFEMRVAHWCDCLSEYTSKQAYDGLKLSFMKKDTPPTISDIVSYIRKAELLNQPSDNELWSILLRAVNEIKTTLGQETPTSMYRTPIYLLKDKSCCALVYEKLPIEVRMCVDFETFILYAGLEEKSISIERNRFLKTIPEVRQAVSEKKMVGINNLYLPKTGRLKERKGSLLKAGD